MRYSYLSLALKNIVRRKMRSWLTIIGIFIGIAAVVSLVSLGLGMQEAVNEQFEMLGIDKIMIVPGSQLLAIGAEGVTLTDKDLSAVNKVHGVENSGTIIYKLGKVEHRNERKYTFVSGIPLDEAKEVWDDISSLGVANGRDLKEGDKYKAMITIRIRDGIFFDKPVAIGDMIKILDHDFEVVGCYDRIGNPQDDSQIIIPIDAAREIFDEPDKYDMIFTKTHEGTNVSKVAQDIKRKLRKSRGLAEGEEDFTVQTTEEVMATYDTILLVIQIVLLGIASISLLVGGVGIMNTMYTSVLERTQEIGVMKAIGAKNSDILTIFLFESGIVGLAGGVIGIAVGIGISKSVEYISYLAGIDLLKAYFPWYLIVGTLAFSFFVGAGAGLLPAVQASKLRPVDALRYE